MCEAAASSGHELQKASPQTSRRSSSRRPATTATSIRAASCSTPTTASRYARPDGFEPPTTWFEAKYSIQLSYGRVAGSVSASVTCLHVERCPVRCLYSSRGKSIVLASMDASVSARIGSCDFNSASPARRLQPANAGLGCCQNALPKGEGRARRYRPGSDSMTSRRPCVAVTCRR